MIPLILLGARQEDHTVNEYAEQDQREVRGLRGWAAGTGANISAYNDVTSILDRWTIDWLRLLIQPVFILSAGEGGSRNVTKKQCITHLLPVRHLPASRSPHGTHDGHICMAFDGTRMGLLLLGCQNLICIQAGLMLKETITPLKKKSWLVGNINK